MRSIDGAWTRSLGRSRRAPARSGHEMMSLATGLVGEGIEDAEGGQAELQGEPHRGGAFLLCHAEAGQQELGDFLLFAGLGFEADKAMHA